MGSWDETKPIAKGADQDQSRSDDSIEKKITVDTTSSKQSKKQGCHKNQKARNVH